MGGSGDERRYAASRLTLYREDDGRTRAAERTLLLDTYAGESLISAESPSPRAVPATRERELLRRYHLDGDRSARNELAEMMLPLAHSLAARFAGRSESTEDLVQVACVGILKAIDGFDVSVTTRFSSYAVPTVLGEIKRHFRDKTWAVRPPRGIQELQMRVAAVRDRLSADLGRSPTVGEIATATQADEEDVLAAIAASGARYSTSFDTPVGEDTTLADQLGGNDPGLDRAEARAVLDGAMHVLSERERRILRLRFEDDLTQEEIADVIGVSQMQISRLIRRSLDRLRIEMQRRPSTQALEGQDASQVA